MEPGGPYGGRPWVVAAGDLLLGASCHGCGVAAWTLCPSCRERLLDVRPVLTAPVPCPATFPFTVAAGPYDPLLRALVSAHKERQALGLTRWLGERLACSVLVVLRAAEIEAGTPVSLVPVPSAARTVRSRGLDAGTALARVAARRLSTRYPVRAERVLTQRRRVADQAGLGADARWLNLSGAYGLRRRPSGLVVLVDDVVTTGASLSEAARVLVEARVPVLGAATIAATERRNGRVS